MNCRKIVDGYTTYYTATWQIYYPDCRQRYFFCNAGNAAYLPAITCCNQGLTNAQSPPVSTTY